MTTPFTTFAGLRWRGQWRRLHGVTRTRPFWLGGWRIDASDGDYRLSGRVAGAAMDVFEQEPPDPSNLLLAMPNVVHTPHSAGTSVASIPNGRRQGAAALAQALNGFWPPHVLNPEVHTRTRFPFVDADQVYATHT